jgi:GTP-binding protein
VQANLFTRTRTLSTPKLQSETRIIDARFLAAVKPEQGVEGLPAPTSVELAFAGRSNVGKSSLINTLVQRKNLVRTSSTPGSTRQINVFEARAQDETIFHLIDLPGYGFTRRSKAETASWRGLIESYLTTRVTLACVVILVDVRRGVENDDRELIDFVRAARGVSRRPVQVIVVATKLDKLPRSSRRVELERLRRAAFGATIPAEEHAEVVPRLIGFSAVTGEGREEVWAALRIAALGAVRSS